MNRAPGPAGYGLNDGQERRIDPSDGLMYTKPQFIQCYGGVAQWEAAAHTSIGGPPKQSTPPRPIPTSLPVQNGTQGPKLPGLGAVVQTIGLSKPELNGMQGSVLRHQGDRVVVELPEPHGEKALRASNLKVVIASPDDDPKAAEEAAKDEPAAKRQRTVPATPPSALAHQPEVEYWATLMPSQKVLVVADPNFSFAYTIARRMGSAEGLVCTDSKMHACVQDTHQHYLIPLFEMGATVCARVDPTRLGKHQLVRRCGQYFDHVVWNFPHATTPTARLPKTTEEYRQVLKRFLQQAELVLSKGGRCAITVKDGEHNEWEVHTLQQGRMQFIGAESFTAMKFPTYAHVGSKAGGSGQFGFPPARTYVFAMMDMH